MFQGNLLQPFAILSWRKRLVFGRLMVPFPRGQSVVAACNRYRSSIPSVRNPPLGPCPPKRFISKRLMYLLHYHDAQYSFIPSCKLHARTAHARARSMCTMPQVTFGLWRQWYSSYCQCSVQIMNLQITITITFKMIGFFDF